jgi:hypothetical protein
MDNDSIERKSWLQRNLKWFIALVVVALLLGSALFSTASDAQMGGYVTALNDNELYQNTLQKARQSKEVSKALGNLNPIDQLAIIESNVEYSNNNTSVNLSVRVTGSKGKGRMDVVANKVNNSWNYQAIKIRIKDPKQEIIVLP